MKVLRKLRKYIRTVMTKKEWLKREVFVDIYGRSYNLSDVPMTYMTFEESLKKKRSQEKRY